MRLGEVLREGRRRAGLEIVDVEQTTKIRIKYLRALESEEWDQLPSPAYAKGFLRTYAQLLGLDADALVDEFRRQVEVGPDDQPFGPQGGARREGRSASKPSSGPPPMFPPIVPILVGLVVLAAIVFAAIGLLGDSGDEGASEPQTKQERRAERREAQRDADAAQGVALASSADVEVCLLDETPDPLVDGPVTAGDEAGPFDAQRLTLRFPEGFSPDDLELTIDGEPAVLEPADGPAAFRIEGTSVEPLDAPPASCP